MIEIARTMSAALIALLLTAGPLSLTASAEGPGSGGGGSSFDTPPDKLPQPDSDPISAPPGGDPGSSSGSSLPPEATPGATSPTLPGTGSDLTPGPSKLPPRLPVPPPHVTSPGGGGLPPTGSVR
ncbi:MAG TPA: hypothetical protein VLX85_16860 [Stellaceae bacterium]|nr:hypothetical protein [Stellaceae bacterium]